MDDLPPFHGCMYFEAKQSDIFFLRRLLLLFSITQEENEVLNFKQSDQGWNCNFLCLIHNDKK
jgi:hypothetical protein